MVNEVNVIQEAKYYSYSIFLIYNRNRLCQSDYVNVALVVYHVHSHNIYSSVCRMPDVSIWSYINGSSFQDLLNCDVGINLFFIRNLLMFKSMDN